MKIKNYIGLIISTILFAISVILIIVFANLSFPHLNFSNDNMRTQIMGSSNKTKVLVDIEHDSEQNLDITFNYIVKNGYFTVYKGTQTFKDVESKDSRWIDNIPIEYNSKLKIEFQIKKLRYSKNTINDYAITSICLVPLVLISGYFIISENLRLIKSKVA